MGYKVNLEEPIPEGLEARVIAAADYKVFAAKGKLSDGIVFKEWQNIWDLNDEVNRTFTSDFEIYGAKSQHQENAEVGIYVAVN